MKILILIMFFFLAVIPGIQARTQPLSDQRLIELIEKTSQAHHQNPCYGGDNLQFIDYFTYRHGTLFRLVFNRMQPCPDFLNQIIYYDSSFQPSITVLYGGLKYQHRVIPADADLNQLEYLSRMSADQLQINGKEITLQEGGRRLREFYLSLDVENGWIAGQHVNWETGVADKPDASSGNHTHCSAFVAAACKRLNIYILRPPEHKQILLANAQFEWLKGNEAVSGGWKPVSDRDPYLAAQRLANKGLVVVAICENPDPSKPGHAALIMPAEMSMDKMEESGPFCIMAATHNFNKISLKNGFKSHLTEWPEHRILFYYNSKMPA